MCMDVKENGDGGDLDEQRINFIANDSAVTIVVHIRRRKRDAVCKCE